MDNDQLAERMEQGFAGVEKRFADADKRVSAMEDRLLRFIADLDKRREAQIEPVVTLMMKFVPAAIGFMQDSGKTTAELSVRLELLERRMERLESAR